MKNKITIQLRVFPLVVRDRLTGEKQTDTIILSKEQLQAAQIVGQSNKELIERLCKRQGRQLLEIGKPERQEVVLDLQEIFAKEGE